MKRTNFAFRYQWSLAIAHLAAEYRLEIFEATVRYAETGATGPMSKVAEEAFSSFILPDFERRRKAAEYRARAKARKAQAENAEIHQMTPQEVVSLPEPSAEIEDQQIAPTPSGPNRRERRRLEAEEKRLQKKRSRNAAARAKHEADTKPEPETPLPPLPRMYTPFWL